MKTFIGALAMLPLMISAAGHEIGSGATLVVTDENVSSYSGGIFFTDDTGVVEFDTSAAPTMDITGAGTVRKTSDADWTMTKEIPGFTGTYELGGTGVVSVCEYKTSFFGLSQSGTPGPLVIKDGTTLDIVNTADWKNLFQTRAIRISGSGKSGAGAIRTLYAAKTVTSMFRNLVLEDDATINLVASGQWYLLNSSIGSITSSDDSKKTLTLSGPGVMQLVPSFTLASNVVVQATGSAVFTLRDERSEHDRISIAPSTTDPIVLEDSATFEMYNLIYDTPPYTNRATIAVDRPLHVKGSDAKLKLTSRYDINELSSLIDRTRDDIDNFKGDITMDSGSKLTLYCHWNRQLQISGELHGSGSLELLSGNASRGRLYISSTNDSFAGTVTLGNSTYHPMLLLGSPGALPDYSKLTVGSGYVGVDLRHWDFASVTNLADTLDYSGINANSQKYIGLDTTFCRGTTVPFCYPGSGTKLPLGGCTGGTILLTNVITTAEDPLCILTAGGTMRIEDEGRPIYISGSTRISHPVEAERSTPPVLEFIDADIRMGSSSPVIGCASQSDRGLFYTVPKIVISNSTLIAENRRSDYADVGTDALIPGGYTANNPHAGGALEIFGDSVVSSKLVVAGIAHYGSGAVYQRGGSVTALGNPDSWDNSSCIGCMKSEPWTPGNSHGYYELSGGTFKALGRFSIGLGSGASWFQSGGHASLGKAPGSDSEPKFQFAGMQDKTTSQCCTMDMYVSGGTFDLGDDVVSDSSITVSGYGYQSKNVQITVDGQDALIDFRNNYLVGNYYTTARTKINLVDGGTLRCGSFACGMAASEFGINFNGGTLRLGSTGNVDIFHRNNTSAPVSYVLVQPGGATIDTDGRDCYTRVPISGVSGKGVKSISMSKNLTGMAFPPMVVIEGDGTGAVAVCEYDSKTSIVSGIKVLCPGSGYTTASAHLRWGNAMVINKEVSEKDFFLTCELGEAENTGGFTKAGAGTFRLFATNTWAGATVVKGGTLTADCDWAVPTNALVVLDGGDLDFNGKTGEVASVTILAGGGEILNAENVKFAGATELKISTGELAAGKSIDLAGDFDLSGVSVRVTGEAAALSDGGRYNVATCDGEFSGELDLVVDSSLAGWSARIVGGRIVLSRIRGTKVIMR